MANVEQSFAMVVMQHLGKYAIAYALLVLIVLYIKSIFFSPLSRYPGPFLAKFSWLWQLKVDISTRRHLVYLAAHKKYGPVFRDGPNSLSFADGAAMQRIYGRGKDSFPRSGSFPGPGVDQDHPPVFFAITAEAHTRARRVVNGPYSMSSILTMENQIDELIRMFKKRLNEKVACGKPFDISKWVNFFTLDIISDLAYGEAFGFLQAGQDVRGIMNAFQSGSVFFTVLGLYPWIARVLLGPPMNKFAKLPENVGLGLTIKIAEDLLDRRYQYGSDRKDLVSAFLSAKDPDGTPISRSQVRGEIIATLVAGGDTTANSICGILGFLIQNPQILHKLREEIDAAASVGQWNEELPRFSELTKLPYLTAVINESLRLSPSVGGTFTRRVPAGGAVVLTDEIVPAGTLVGVNNWVMGRNRNIYGPDAELFKPERWLDESNRKELRDYDFAFGHGARVCIGRNLALVELYKTTYELVRHYDIQPENPARLWKEEQKLFLYKTDFRVLVSKRSH